jgi:molecular chaperone GrpE
MGAPEERGLKEPAEKEGRPAKQQKQKKRYFAGKPELPVPQESQPTQIVVDEVSSLREQLRQEQEKSKEHLNKLLYAQADFENYRRRLNQEVGSKIDAGKAGLIQNLLAIVDELELALNAAKETEGASAVANGLDIILKKFRDLLIAEGLSVIESKRKKFDPTLHEAVERVPCGDEEEGTILEEIRKGYTLKGRLIRPSIVKIAVPQIAEPNSSKSAEGESS